MPESMEKVEDRWKQVLEQQGIHGFDSLWDMKIKKIDQPNTMGSGWSEVGYYSLPEPVESITGLYIKRQQDYGIRKLSTLFRLVPSYYIEFMNLKNCEAKGLPVVKPVLFSMRQKHQHKQAILVTQALNDYFALSDKQQVETIGITSRYRIIRAVAKEVRRLHDSGLQHGCLYPKHIFVKIDENNNQEPRVCFIDMEKTQALSWLNKGIWRDLDSLNRRAYGWNTRDRVCFLTVYCRGDRNSARRIINKLTH